VTNGRNIDAHKAQTLGIDAFVMKPWEFGDLTRTIRQVLARRNGSVASLA
jgi:DNA-binding NarL/FixJ family response regulator